MCCIDINDPEVLRTGGQFNQSAMAIRVVINIPRGYKFFLLVPVHYY